MNADKFVQRLADSRDASLVGWQQLTDAFAVAADAATTFVPEGATCRTLVVGDVPVEIFTPPSAQGSVLFLHGGNYILPLVDEYRRIACRMAAETGKAVVVPDYAVAPARYPDALDEVFAVWEWLYAQDDRIALAGDGSGAALAVSLVLFLAGEGPRMPSGLALLSPQLDMTCSGNSYYDNYYLDVIYGRRKLAGQDIPDAFRASPLWAYCRGCDLASPEISPLWADLTPLPPCHVTVGGHEVVLSDAERFAERAAEAGVDVTLMVGEGLFYAYPYCYHRFDEARRAFGEICRFLRKH